MPRLLSVALTADAVTRRDKTVTRRLGWWCDKHGRRLLHPGDRLTLCRKVQGRRRADGTVEPLVRLAEVEVVTVRRERLCDITPADVAREGFPRWTVLDFVTFFCKHMGCGPDTWVTRIEWTYLDIDNDTEVDGG